MKFSHVLFCFLLINIFTTSIINAEENNKSNIYLEYKLQCLKDLEFIRTNMEENSAPFKNPNDKEFKMWFDKGYGQTKELIEDIQDKNDCYYALKYYINGFSSSHISLRSYISFYPEKYPGILTAKYGNNHIVIYKDSYLSYLNKINIGDQLTHINDMTVDSYFKEYIEPFYSNDKSEFSKKSASIYTLIVDSNPYVPIPLKATFTDGKNINKVELKYTALSNEPLQAAKNIRQPDPQRHFKIKMIAGGVWISIPSFYLTNEEVVFYNGMLSQLKNLAKEEYILFDLRGNKGGASKWQRPLIRNLWGDGYIQSLGSKHVYNDTWIKKVRVSKLNFIEFKKTANASEIKKFATLLNNDEDFFEKKWKIYNEDLNLYTNKDISPIQAKIYVLTDYFCRSTCWTFVNELTQIPGVTHIGAPTTIQSYNSFSIKVKTPSGNFDFFYPTDIRVSPNRNLGHSLIPSNIFNGDMANEVEILNWFLTLLDSK